MAKILIIGKYYSPYQGGIEENTRCVAEYAARHHEIDVLVNSHDGKSSEEIINGVRVIRRSGLGVFRGQPIALRLFAGIKVRDYDVIHFHSPNPFAAVLLSLLIGFRRRPLIVVTHHMDIYGRRLLRALTLPFLQFLMRRASAVIITSVKNRAISKDLPRTARYEVVPLALDLDNYAVARNATAAAEWRNAFSSGAKTIGFLGRHARYKGLTVLIDAVAQLPDVHAIIAGDGPYRKEAEERALAAGVADRVHFVGGIDHETKLKLLSSVDVFAFPSTEITEAFGISQMEAMLCGAPVVASNLPTGVTDVAIDGHTALLVEPGNAIDLADKIALLLADRELADKLGQNGRTHILNNMTTAIVARRTLEIFEEALQ